MIGDSGGEHYARYAKCEEVLLFTDTAIKHFRKSFGSIVVIAQVEIESCVAVHHRVGHLAASKGYQVVLAATGRGHEGRSHGIEVDDHCYRRWIDALGSKVVDEGFASAHSYVVAVKSHIYEILGSSDRFVDI